MPHREFVIVNAKETVYFAKNKSNYFTQHCSEASRWNSEEDGKNALNKILNNLEIENMPKQLTVKELKNVSKPADKEEIDSMPSDDDLTPNQISDDNDDIDFIDEDDSWDDSMSCDPSDDTVFTEEDDSSDVLDDDNSALTDDEDGYDFVESQPLKELNLPDYEDFLDQLEDLCFLMINARQIKRQLEKKITESDYKDLDFLHVLELGKFDAVQGSQLIKWEKESRQQRRQYKDELWIIGTLFPVANDGLAENAERCLEILEKIKKNKRLYRFRSKEIEEKFGKLLPQNSEMNENDRKKRFRNLTYSEQLEELIGPWEKG